MTRPASRFASILALILVAALAVPHGGTAAEGDKTKGKTTTEKRGGYSYSQAQTINTYGDSRGRYGAADSLRDPNIDRQTNFGPFDHGFFYDNGVGAGQHGGNAPYLH